MDKKVILCDLDGTLCDLSHRLHFVKQDKPDWDAFYKACVDDAPKPEIIQLITGMMQTGCKVYIVSGRSDIVRQETIDWIEKHVGLLKHFPFEIVMRKHGDYTKDNELKQNWLHEGRFGPIEEILFALDDRQRVVDMWRDNGLTCLQVAQWEE